MVKSNVRRRRASFNPCVLKRYNYIVLRGRGTYIYVHAVSQQHVDVALCRRGFCDLVETLFSSDVDTRSEYTYQCRVSSHLDCHNGSGGQGRTENLLLSREIGRYTTPHDLPLDAMVFQHYYCKGEK